MASLDWCQSSVLCAVPTIQLLEYANTQLPEFRHYDEVLTRVLNTVCRALGHRGRFLRRWKMAGEAERLNALRLDVRELAERTDNAIKFLSDMFYARAFILEAMVVAILVIELIDVFSRR